MERKFNIGDKVVEITPDLYGNEFHKDKIIKTYRVYDANDEIFTINNNKIDFWMSGHQQFSQTNGWNKDSYASIQLFHAEKDKNIILEKIKEGKDAFLSETKTEVDERIKHLKKLIEIQEKEIKRLESGETAIKYKTVEFDLKDYIEK